MRGLNLTFEGQVECNASLMLSMTEERDLLCYLHIASGKNLGAGKGDGTRDRQCSWRLGCGHAEGKGGVESVERMVFLVEPKDDDNGFESRGLLRGQER